MEEMVLEIYIISVIFRIRIKVYLRCFVVLVVLIIFNFGIMLMLKGKS